MLFIQIRGTGKFLMQTQDARTIFIPIEWIWRDFHLNSGGSAGFDSNSGDLAGFHSDSGTFPAFSSIHRIHIPFISLDNNLITITD
jgi:hypothetical protein